LHSKLLHSLLTNIGIAGCSGLSFSLDYVQEKGKFDEEVQQDGSLLPIYLKFMEYSLGVDREFEANPTMQLL
jgi:Fe-S cluster assembly iron-binding protein IscA